MLKVWAVVVFGAATAHAEPCAILTLQPEVLGPTTEVVAEGGVVVGLVPKMESKATDLKGWNVKGTTATGVENVAPGLFVIRPTKGKATIEVVDAKGKTRATAKVVAKPAAVLPAPAIAKIVSGTSKGKHPTQFVTVTLKDPAPAGARALVLAKGDAIGVNLSWGATAGGANEVSVYSTQGGCVMQFPDGTVMAQPRDSVRAFWIDSYGRRSPASPEVAVVAP